MICALKKKYLKDDFIETKLINNLDNISFNKNNIIYFGNYEENKLEIIFKKLLKNKEKIIKALESGKKIIVTGNSCNLFNIAFKPNKSLNLFNCYDIKIKNNKLRKYKKISSIKNNKIQNINNLNEDINYSNFRYKNFIYISNNKNIKKRTK